MTIESDFLKQRNALASVLYDAFLDEIKHRKGLGVEEWIRLELQAVHRAACNYASEHGIPAPSMELVATAERYARGSLNYGSKWALMLAATMAAAPPRHDPEPRTGDCQLM